MSIPTPKLLDVAGAIRSLPSLSLISEKGKKVEATGTVGTTHEIHAPCDKPLAFPLAPLLALGSDLSGVGG
jgi:hypothetical protein